MKIFSKKSGVFFQNFDRVGVLGSFFVFKFPNLIKNIYIFFSIKLKLKYLFGKASFIAVILGCLG